LSLQIKCVLQISSRRKGASEAAGGYPGLKYGTGARTSPGSRAWNLLPTSYGHHRNARWNNAFHIGVFWKKFTL